MHIALNARHMIPERLEGIGTVTHEVMSRIARMQQEDRFDYYFDRKFNKSFIHSANVTGHAFFPQARLPILIRYWLNHPVKRNIQRQKPDVFFSPDGFVPIKLKTPKVTMVHDIAFLRNPLHVTPRIRKFYEDWMPVFINETDHIITVSDFSKTELISGYGIAPEKISVVHNGVSADYKPLPEEGKKDVREQYMEGKPFFLYLGAIHPRKNILTLIRAFENFKSETNSDFRLIIAGRPSWYTKEIYRSVEASPWRQDIHLPGFIESDLARKFLASAHALVYPSRYEGFGLPVIEAMASGTPVICSNIASLPEIAGEAALFFDPGDIDELVVLLKRVADDEDIRTNLIGLGHTRIRKFSWDEAARSIYGILERFSGK